MVMDAVPSNEAEDLWALRERAKELRCLYSVISALSRREESPNVVFNWILEGFHPPGSTQKTRLLASNILAVRTHSAISWIRLGGCVPRFRSGVHRLVQSKSITNMNTLLFWFSVKWRRGVLR